MELVRTFPLATTTPSEARLALRPLDGVLSPDKLDDLRLVVSELVTNAVLHSGLTQTEPITVRIKVLAGRVRVEVLDAGFAFPEVLRRPTDRHGRGLSIVARLADRWGTESRPETRVWAELRLD
jgi:anti-sigma regulatory factor (Ser/Thr protein kinase)